MQIIKYKVIPELSLEDSKFCGGSLKLGKNNNNEVILLDEENGLKDSSPIFRIVLLCIVIYYIANYITF